MRDLLCSSKIFLFASRREGIGNAVAQALATGLPCVLSDIPALRALWLRALMVPPDPQRFACTVLDLLYDQERRDSLKDKGIPLAREMNNESVKRKMKYALDRSY